MGFGTTAKKLQTVTEMGEKLYTKVDELRNQVNEVKTHVEATSQRIKRVERELDEQRAILDALADEQGIDVDERIAEVTIKEAEPDHEIAASEPATEGGADASDAGTDEVEVNETGTDETDTDRSGAEGAAEAGQ